MEISDRGHKCYAEITDRHEKHNGFTPNNTQGLVWYTNESKSNKGTGAGLYRWGLRREHSFSLGLHATVFQAEMCAIKACVMENAEKSYKGRNIYILSNSQAAINVHNNFQINSKLVWDCHPSQLKQAEQDRIQLIWHLGNMGIDKNEKVY